MNNKQVLRVKSVNRITKTITLEWVKDPDYINPLVTEYGDGSGEDPHFPSPWIGSLGTTYYVDREGRLAKAEEEK